jgi:hypothetical protein
VPWLLAAAGRKNSENFRILQSHNMLSARHMQKPLKLLLTNAAEIGKNREARNTGTPKVFSLHSQKK